MIIEHRRCCDHQLSVDGTVQWMRFIDLFICQTKPIYLRKNYFAVGMRSRFVRQIFDIHFQVSMS